MAWLLAFILCLTLFSCWIATLLGLPGNWLIVLATILYTGLIPADSRLALGWPVVLTLIIFALLGEAIEFLASALGVARVGASKRSACLALVGSLFGAVFGVFVGLPIPLLGSLIATLFFASSGALAGAMLGEWWAGKPLGASWQAGHAAFWGRLAGTLGKTLVGAIMVAITLTAMCL